MRAGLKEASSPSKTIPYVAVFSSMACDLHCLKFAGPGPSSYVGFFLRKFPLKLPMLATLITIQRDGDPKHRHDVGTAPQCDRKMRLITLAEVSTNKPGASRLRAGWIL